MAINSALRKVIFYGLASASWLGFSYVCILTGERITHNTVQCEHYQATDTEWWEIALTQYRVGNRVHYKPLYSRGDNEVGRFPSLERCASELRALQKLTDIGRMLLTHSDFPDQPPPPEKVEPEDTSDIEVERRLRL